MRRVALIAFTFPPFSGISVNRWASFAHYFCARGIPVDVYTSQIKGETDDFSILHGVIPENMSIQYLPTFSFFTKKQSAAPGTIGRVKERKLTKKIINSVFIPDVYILWVLWNMHRIIKGIKKSGADIIITTGPPFSLHVLGIVCKRILHMTWICDFRDPWIGHKPYVSGIAVSARLSVWLEKKAVSLSDCVLVINRKFKDTLCRRISGIESKTHVILNGYEREFFQPSGVQVEDRTRLKLLYAGTFNSWRTPQNLLDAIKCVEGRHPGFANAVAVKFIGKLFWNIEEYAMRTGLTTEIIVGENAAFTDFIAELQAADWLVLIISAREGSIIESGKFPYYIGARKPVLALAPAGSPVHGIVEKYTLGCSGVYEDTDSIAACLEKIYLKELPFIADEELVSRYARKKQFEKMFAVIRETMKSMI